MDWDAADAHWCQLNVSWAVETAAIQTKPAYAGFKTLVFPLVRAGGLRFYSRQFHSPGLKLTPMADAVPLQKTDWFLDNCQQKIQAIANPPVDIYPINLI